MQIVHETPRQLIIQQRRPVMAIVSALFALTSAFLVLNTGFEGLMRANALNTFQLIAWGIWLVIVTLFMGLGVLGCVNSMRGVRCVFDRDSETVEITRSGLLRAERQSHSIFAVSHIDVVNNESLRVYGIFLVIRPGRRIGLATVPPFAHESAQMIAHRVGAFLQNRANEDVT